MAGRFVVLEGGDGSGKSTQAALLARELRARGVSVCETFEPGATPVGKVIRELLLHGSEAIAPATEALLMAADRAQHVAEQIAPALDRGEWVVCDRYLPSSLVYQGTVRGLGVPAVEALNRAAVDAVEPDLVVVIDVPDDVARERARRNPDRFEAEDDGFHVAVRDAYRTLSAAHGWTVVDGAGAIDEVAARVWAAVEPLLAG
jgi:dTMP kinase